MATAHRLLLQIAGFSFTFIPGDLVIFDAVDGPCFDGIAPGYPVINGACDEFYQPGDDPTKTVPAPDCVGSTLHYELPSCSTYPCVPTQQNYKSVKRIVEFACRTYSRLE